MTSPEIVVVDTVEASPIVVVGGENASTTVETVFVVGPQGPPGPSGGQGYVHTQTVPAGTWLITHNLGRKPTVVLVIDNQQVFTDIFYSSLNSVTVVWPEPTAGEAHLV